MNLFLQSNDENLAAGSDAAVNLLTTSIAVSQVVSSTFYGSPNKSPIVSGLHANEEPRLIASYETGKYIYICIHVFIVKRFFNYSNGNRSAFYH